MRAIRRTAILLAASVAVAALGTAPAPALGPSGTWETKAPMSPRGDAMAGVIAGRLYAAGGGAPGGGSTNTLLEYDPATDAWATKAPMPTSRAVGGGAVIDGKLYVVGGWLNSDSNTPTGVLEVYDPVTNTWATRAPMPTPRGSMAVAAIGGKLYVTGGRGPCCTQYAQLEIYDSATNTWTAGAPLPTARETVAAAAVGGKLYVVGGNILVPGPAHAQSDVVEAYDPATDTWASLAAMPTARAGAAAGVLGGSIHVVGGSNATSGALAVHEAYDPVANAWTSQAPMPTGRRVAAADVVGERLYVVGGSNPAGTLGTNEAFTPSAGTTVRFGTDQGAPPCLNVLRRSCNAGGSIPWFAGAALAGAFRIAPDSTYQPDLVDRVVVGLPDKTQPFTLTYEIKNAAVWSDGAPVSADDFLFTLAVITDPANEIGGAVARAPYELIERATAIDAKTVRFELANPYAAWRDLFPWVLPKHVLAGRDFDTVWQTAIDDPATGAPIGSGPFLVTGFDGSTLTLARNDAWWGTPAPALDRVVARFYNGTGPLVAALQGGELDAIYTTNVAGTAATRASLAGLRADPTLAVQSNPGAGIEHLELNLAAADMPLLAQAWFRRAIAYALDREAVATRLFGAVAPGTTAAQSLIYSPTQAEYEPHFSRYPYDPAAVRAIMEEQGCVTGADAIWSCGGIRASVKLATTTGNPSRAEAQDELITKARAAGIELVADNSPAGFLFGTRLPSGAYQMSMFTWIWSTGDPIGFTDIYSCGGATNFTSYCSKPVTTFLGRADGELDPARRAALVNRAHSRLSSDVPGIPLYRRPTFLAYETALAGLRDNPVPIEGPTWNIEQWRPAG